MRAGFPLVFILIAQSLFACGRPAEPVSDPVSRYYKEAYRAIRVKPAWACLPTLDGRCVPLTPFIEAVRCLLA